MLRSRFDTERFTVKLGMFFARFGVSPNVWTLIALVPAVGGFLVLSFYADSPTNLLISLFLFAVSGFLDVIDGAVARVTSRVSALGAFLDGVIDRYVEILLYMGLLIHLNAKDGLFIPNSFWISLLVFGSLMPSFIRAYADHRKVVTEQSALRAMGGLLERAERLALIYAGMLLGALFGPALLIYAIAAASVLANYTALQRLWFVVRYGKAG